MNNHNILTVAHLSPEPQEGYGPDAPVLVTYSDGRPDAYSQWGSDVGDGGVLAWRAEHGDEAAIAYTAPPEPDPVPAMPRPVAAAFGARIENGDITEIGKSAGLAGAYMMTGMYLMMFSTPQTDVDYYPKVSGSGAIFTATDKAIDYFIIEAKDGNGDYVDPECFDVEIWRID